MVSCRSYWHVRGFRYGWLYTHLHYTTILITIYLKPNTSIIITPAAHYTRLIFNLLLGISYEYDISFLIFRTFNCITPTPVAYLRTPYLSIQLTLNAIKLKFVFLRMYIDIHIHIRHIPI